LWWIADDDNNDDDNDDDDDDGEMINTNVYYHLQYHYFWDPTD